MEQRSSGVKSAGAVGADDLVRREIGRWQHRAAQLREGLRNLTEIERDGVNVETRHAMTAAKLRRVEARIWRLSQRRLI